ncbi:hypothetical protein HJ588_00425 [Flexivirga sp. ID2601S]|uniref:Uncharacterized protein n=1 Tax=Flexivirga aerilata TaxID=1656889 RepID=A0A849AEU9_9MICO|nr:hypothetical protein [Flexivirga aerilata]NNG37741.1 hypothetical protein [Flexivirga aerilata]
MRAGVGVLAVVRVDAAVDAVEFGEDAVLFAFEQGQRDCVGVVGLEQSFLFVLEPVAAGGGADEFVGLGGHELVERVVQHPGEGFAVGGGDLDALVVVLDQLLHVTAAPYRRRATTCRARCPQPAPATPPLPGRTQDPTRLDASQN